MPKENAPRDVTKDPMAAHEVLDQAFIASDFFDGFVANHPFVLATPELSKAADEICERLADFYQLAGKYALDE